MINAENKLSFWSFAFLWCGASISIAEILVGGFVAPLGFKLGLVSILLGHLLGTLLLMLGGVIGARERVPAITSTRRSFGLWGTWLFALLNVLQLLGWTAIMIKTASISLNGISKELWGFDSLTLWNVVIGGLIASWIWLGMKTFKRLNVVAVVLLLGLTFALAREVFSKGGLLAGKGEGSISFGGALELSVVMPLSWLPLIADYARFAKTEKAAAYGSFWGYFIGSSWMYFIGMCAAIVAGNSDPSAILLAAKLGIAAFGIVLLSTVTTTFMDAYSAGVSFLNIAPKMNEKALAIAATAIGTGLSLTFPIDQYESFLYMIGSVFGPLFAIVLVDYFLVGNRAKAKESVLLNIGAASVWILGVVSYYCFKALDLPVGVTLPSMAFTGALYYISHKKIARAELIQSSRSA